MNAATSFGSFPPDIKTRAERDQLEAARPVPQSAPQPSPAPDAPAVNQAVAQQNEARIVEIDQSFARIKAQADVDHAFSRLEGYAQAHFQHSH